ncbi:hypothetical protein PGT21_000868 [Puccinia graminis f. sp. tritici]|uniref:Uncharacterized protein n=1 Tax=Puccinia graminis f. sp. tritici TaxID=56615 RepID=A0A5B0N061_PUCGR|nr:hypothetical protein PGTUg99_030427 [Puccinia graminis f. sp. tritici]KAA1085010.1 hypothetical protein PGT21_000868 [Puccinia graminis f. sp. tritici]
MKFHLLAVLWIQVIVTHQVITRPKSDVIRFLEVLGIRAYRSPRPFPDASPPSFPHLSPSRSIEASPPRSFWASPPNRIHQTLRAGSPIEFRLAQMTAGSWDAEYAHLVSANHIKRQNSYVGQRKYVPSLRTIEEDDILDAPFPENNRSRHNSDDTQKKEPRLKKQKTLRREKLAKSLDSTALIPEVPEPEMVKQPTRSKLFSCLPFRRVSLRKRPDAQAKSSSLSD